jgi:PAS domain-containing protein
MHERMLPRVWLFGSGVLLLAWLAALVLNVQIPSVHWGLWGLGVAIVVAGFVYVTQSTRTLADLERRANDYHAFVEQAADGVFIADLATGKCLQANLALAKMLRRPIEAVEQLTLSELLRLQTSQTSLQTLCLFCRVGVPAMSVSCTAPMAHAGRSRWV